MELVLSTRSDLYLLLLRRRPVGAEVCAKTRQQIRLDALLGQAVLCTDLPELRYGEIAELGRRRPLHKTSQRCTGSGLGRTRLEYTRECVLGCRSARIRERVDECASARASAIVHAPIFVRYLLRRLRLRFSMSRRRRRRLLSDTCRLCSSRLLCRLLCRLGRFRGALNGIEPIGCAPVEHVQQGRLQTRATEGLDGTGEATLAFASAAAAASLASSAPACGCQPSHSSAHAT